MTKEKLYQQLMEYKDRYGVSQEVYQRYLWALETLAKTNSPPPETSEKDTPS